MGLKGFKMMPPSSRKTTSPRPRRLFEGEDTPEGGATRRTALIQIFVLPLSVAVAAAVIGVVAVCSG
ncbi:MAG: hypothetical protein LKF80_08995 [Brevundimonas sp.]|jgi:hypothetical protein|uniref:hypothetical protein n=2 Tax=Brevundimonas TaxID=41275 RepID=UPI000FB0D2F5|nr:hypothetical protein [Brevundimonas sp.]MCH4268523.1 hypothetical protein [Brevundimonas sp.]